MLYPTELRAPSEEVISSELWAVVLEEATGSIAHYILQLSTQDSELSTPLRFGRGERI